MYVKSVAKPRHYYLPAVLWSSINAVHQAWSCYCHLLRASSYYKYAQNFHLGRFFRTADREEAKYYQTACKAVLIVLKLLSQHAAVRFSDFSQRFTVIKRFIDLRTAFFMIACPNMRILNRRDSLMTTRLKCWLVEKCGTAVFTAATKVLEAWETQLKMRISKHIMVNTVEHAKVSVLRKKIVASRKWPKLAA